jgi:hypothetical protein
MTTTEAHTTDGRLAASTAAGEKNDAHQNDAVDTRR